MAKEVAIVVNDSNAIVIKRQFDNKEQARIEINDAVAPRGEQVLRTLTITVPKHWNILGADANGAHSISIQLCSQD